MDSKDQQSSVFSALWKTLTSVSRNDFKHLVREPCFKQSQIVGATTGLGVGGIQLMLKARKSVALNWAFFTYVGMCIASWEGCNYRQRQALKKLDIELTQIEGKLTKRRQARDFYEK
ncbi:hypothetical protein SJAG_06046 [Schizosaccharomyces japonicus yFS275]|uniref:Cytochrome c oxidase assembly protein COX20, mitochondrial n=1 Tax=Schizosaccharomyces japonicus (strain yFS275 / FY16936) TaxID=402676 RepID=T0RSY9_SCHJY|nr:hypothetical protein SJAG_06046 [Schizosaccharomyces japonicus yFS275]EQC53060.1 hypothetical protein SJAG_06046 [Schizosaccharomyces japonicus yFS275]